MGYYSEACLCLKKGIVDQYKARLSLPNSRQLLEDLLENAEHLVDPDTGDEMWHWKSVKWYPDYEDIALMEKLIADTDGDHYRFIRIGEDADDNEVSGWFWDNPFGLSLERNLIYERPDNGN